MLLVLALGVMTACGGSGSGGGEHALVGSWTSAVDGQFWYNFNANGNGTRGLGVDSESFSWTTSGGRVTMTGSPSLYATFAEGVPQEVWSYSVRGNTVTFTSDLIPGYEFVFNRD